MVRQPQIDYFTTETTYEQIYDLVLAYASGNTEKSQDTGETGSARSLLATAAQLVHSHGLVFIYGSPAVLPYYAQYLQESLSPLGPNLTFKYWIAIRTEVYPNDDAINSGHMGLLLYAPHDSFDLAKARSPHQYCKACGQNLRDWGGKRHLMHPEGVALSDIWKDMTVSLTGEVPDELLQRVLSLSPSSKPSVLMVPLPSADILFDEAPEAAFSYQVKTEIEADKVLLGDCIEEMRRLPDGCVDLAFADPPYNLGKEYTSYDDSQHNWDYLKWCNEWLYQYQRILSPTGSLFVLNLPKWAIHHKVFLDRYLHFQNWIAWDAMSEPRGKLMPAHYALLYYTKHPTERDFDGERAYQLSPNFCLRASCRKERDRNGIHDHTPITDIWWDIPRIRHKRDRDFHPCQLPERLLERIIGLASRPGDLVFDGFSGTGTTAVVAKRMGRRYLAIDMDKYYVELTIQKLEALDREDKIPRPSLTRRRPEVTKKELQLELLKLSQSLQRYPTEEDIERYSKYPLALFRQKFPTLGKALRAVKVHNHSPAGTHSAANIG